MATNVQLVLNVGEPLDMRIEVADDGGAPIDVTGATVVAKVRSAFPDASPLVTLTGTVIDGPGGVIGLSLSAAAIAGIAVPVGTTSTVRDVSVGSWDATITVGAWTQRVAEGSVLLSRWASA